MNSLPLNWLLDFGLSGVAAISLLEKFLPVLPSYILFVSIGLATVDNALDLFRTVLVASLGSTLGAAAWYSIGHILGGSRCEDIIGRYGRFVFLRPELYRRLAAAYRRNHFWVTVIGQTIPTVRIYLALPAGILGLPMGSLLLATLIGTLAWNTPLIAIGYLLRDSGWDPLAAGIAVGLSMMGLELLMVFIITYARRRAPRK
ncbi:DedA family protein [Rhizobium sp. AG207R]|uniref:DedA family protein n=1 Tax=Rhizobium sp. AG207R TaxID=2802287 RepID=UPI0022AC8FEF|nr:DedA family protein [Rhizobium sp. AG207R]MCZ3378142.1 DedA family protein [Rhizobium sp. AG207R]